MNIRIRLPLNVLETRVNEIVTAQLSEVGQQNEKGGVSFIDVKQLSSVKLKNENGHLVSTMDVEVEALVSRGEPGLLDMLREVSGFEKLSFELSVSMHTHIEIGEDWAISSTSHASYEWLRKPKLGFSVLKVNIGGIIQPFLESELEEVAIDIDTKIGEEVDLPGIVKLAWEEMQQVQKIEESFPVWLSLIPEHPSVSMRPPQWQPKAIVTHISVPLEVKALLKVQNEAHEPISYIPQMVHVGQIPQRSAFILKSLIDYKTLGTFLTQSDIHEASGRISLRLKEAHLSGEAAMLRGRFLFEGSLRYMLGRKKIRGVCLLNGPLEIEESSQLVNWEIESCAFEQLGWIDGVMSRIYRKKIKRELQAGIRSALAYQLKDVRERISTEMACVRLNTFVEFKSKLYRFIPQRISLTERGIEIDFDMSTEMVIEVVSLETDNEERVNQAGN